MEGPPGPPPLALTHIGLQMAPCGCCFYPRLFHMEWASTHLPPPPTPTLAHGIASLPPVALWGPRGYGIPSAWAAPGTPQGQPPHLTPSTNQRTPLAPAPLALLTSSPSYQQHQGQPMQMHISGVATLGRVTPESHICPGSNIPHSPSPAPYSVGDTASDLAVSLEKALRISECSLDTQGLSQDGPKSGPMPADPADTGAAVPPSPSPRSRCPRSFSPPTTASPRSLTPSWASTNSWGCSPTSPGGMRPWICPHPSLPLSPKIRE